MKRIGEIVIVRPDVLIAQGERKALPPIGSVLKTDKGIFCIVASHSIDNRIPGRVPTAYGKSISTLEEEQPQVFALMKWMFQIIPFGALVNGEVNISYPTFAVEIHSLLYYANDEEIEEMLGDLSLTDFLFGIDKMVLPQRDEVIVAFLNNYFLNFSGESLKKEYLRVFSHLSVILRNDYTTLKKIMDRVKI